MRTIITLFALATIMLFSCSRENEDFVQNDTVENLDFNTLSHQGTYLMPLLDFFSKQDLTQMTTSEDLIYFNMKIEKLRHPKEFHSK